MKSNLPKPSQLLFFLLSLFFFGFATNTSAQLNLNVTVDSGSSTTTCGDNFGAADPHWRVNINNQGWTTYPATNFCYQNTPFLQYSEPYLCPTQLPNQIQVCFRAFEDDGSFCTPSHSCDEIICEDFQVPDVGTTQNYTLALPNGLSSGGQVNFSISVNGIYPGPPNDFICNAIDFGVLNENSSVGDAANSVYTNICGSNDNDPPLSGFANEQGVWFSFTTNNNPDVTYINAVSDPSNFGDDLNIQFALYESDNGNCNGNLNQVLYSSNTSTGLDEFRALECLEPNTTYFLLIDGSFTSADMVEGAFGLEISNNGSTAASDLPCGAEDLGLIPNNGSVTVENQNNYCSSHSFPEPSTIGFVSQRSVWYQFTVPNSGHVLIEAESDPTGFDPIGLQLAAFSSNGGCNGPFSQIDSEYTFMDFDESLELSCLEPGSTIWLLIDGDGTETQGVYNLSVSDAGVLPPQSITEIDPFICDGETYEVGPLSFSTSGFFSVTVNAYNGCDSLITGMLTVLPAYDEVLDTTICAGQTITVGNSVYDATGNYQDILPTVGGCDSIINTTLVVTGNLTVTATQTVQATNYQIADGAATANAMGGAGNLTYEWSDGQTGTAANNLEGGTNYCVTVTDDLGCSAEDCLLVLFPSNIIPNVVDVLLDCPGDVDGTLNLSVSNGAAPYGYSWENTTDNSINGNGAIPTEGGTATINSLAAGTYSFTVSDAFGLTVTEATITEPAPIITNLNPVLCNGEILSVGMSNVNTSGPFSVTVPSFLGCDSTISGVLTILDPIASTINETLCFGESLTVGNVNYNSSGPISEVIPAFNGCDSTITGNLTILPQILTTIDTTICFGENLAVNGISYEQSTIFSETIPAQNGCDSIINVDLEVLDEIISNSSLTNEASGPGLSDGAAAVNPSGGNGNYSYLWSTGATTANVNALLAGEQVCVTITDNLGCEIIDCLLVTFPSNIELSIENDTLNCFGDVDGSLLLDIEFGIAPYQYVWQNTANTLNGSGTVNTQNADALLSGLLPGTYSVTVTDAIGEAIAQALVVEPLLLTASSSNNPASCFEECDGTASVSISGGTAPYQYFWPNGTVNNSINNLCAGDYEVTVFDSKGCSLTENILVEEPEELIITAVTTEEVSCPGNADGAAAATLTNGEAQSYLWSNGETTATASGFFAGPQSVTITDVNGCTATATVQIVEPLEAIDVTIDLLQNASCFDGNDGALLSNVTGGTEPYSFSWSNNTASALANGLAAGSYEVTVTDVNGCSAIASEEVLSPEAIISQILTKEVTCPEGENSGAITVEATSGGAGGYIYALDGVNFSTDTSFQNLPEGEYLLSVQDIEGCITSTPVVVEGPDEILLELGPTETIDLGENVTLNGVYFNQNLVFEWTTGLSASDCFDCPRVSLTPMQTTVYQLVATDTTSGCTATAEQRVEVLAKRDVYIPNAFSPNGDGTNDVFFVNAGPEVSQINTLRIFNRWGAPVYEVRDVTANDFRNGWDGFFKGKAVETGVYVYFAEVEFIDGEVLRYEGDLTVVR